MQSASHSRSGGVSALVRGGMATDLLNIARAIGLADGPSSAKGAAARAPGFTTTVHSSADVASFETVVRRAAAEQAAASGAARSDPATTAPPAVKNANKARKSFEAFALQVFIGSMLPKENAKLFGTGSAGKLWQSLLAEKLAEQIASSGRLKLLPEAGVGGATELAQIKVESAPGASSGAADGRRADQSKEIR